MNDLISRQAAIDALGEKPLAWTEGEYELGLQNQWQSDVDALNDLPSVQPERLTDDDFETIRIHLNAIKEKLCNQHRWKEAEEYQRIIDRFMAFASVQERKRGRWVEYKDYPGLAYLCSECNHFTTVKSNYCPNCGASMTEGAEDAGRDEN